jgi:hypothetical protein
MDVYYLEPDIGNLKHYREFASLKILQQVYSGDSVSSSPNAVLIF